MAREEYSRTAEAYATFTIEFLICIFAFCAGLMFLLPQIEHWTIVGYWTIGIALLCLVLAFIKYRIKIKRN